MIASGQVPEPKKLSEGRKAWDRLALDSYVDSLGNAPDENNPWDEVFNGTASA